MHLSRFMPLLFITFDPNEFHLVRASARCRRGLRLVLTSEGGEPLWLQLLFRPVRRSPRIGGSGSSCERSSPSLRFGPWPSRRIATWHLRGSPPTSAPWSGASECGWPGSTRRSGQDSCSSCRRGCRLRRSATCGADCCWQPWRSRRSLSSGGCLLRDTASSAAGCGCFVPIGCWVLLPRAR